MTQTLHAHQCVSQAKPPASWVLSCSLCWRVACQTSPHAPLAKCLSRSYTLPCPEALSLPVVQAPLILSLACGSCSKRTGCEYAADSGSNPACSGSCARCWAASGAMGVSCSAAGQSSQHLSFDAHLPAKLKGEIGLWAKAWGPGTSATICTRLEGRKAAQGSVDLPRHRIMVCVSL